MAAKLTQVPPSERRGRAGAEIWVKVLVDAGPEPMDASSVQLQKRGERPVLFDSELASTVG